MALPKETPETIEDLVAAYTSDSDSAIEYLGCVDGVSQMAEAANVHVALGPLVLPTLTNRSAEFVRYATLSKRPTAWSRTTGTRNVSPGLMASKRGGRLPSSALSRAAGSCIASTLRRKVSW